MRRSRIRTHATTAIASLFVALACSDNMPTRAGTVPGRNADASPGVRVDDDETLEEAAKDYSAMIDEWERARAREILEAGKLALEKAAEGVLETAHALEGGGILGTTVEATAAAAAATGATAAAGGAVVDAGLAVGATALAVGAFNAGTEVAQEANFWASRCWRHWICPLFGSNAQSNGARAVSVPTGAEIDALIPGVLHASGASPAVRTKAQFDSADAVTPGSGSIGWNYLRAGTRASLDLTQGAAAFNAGRCQDVLDAASDLRPALDELAVSIRSTADFIASARVFSGDPLGSLADARQKLLAMQERRAEFSDPQAVQLLIDRALVALDSAVVAVRSLTDNEGRPRPLEGEFGLLPSLTRERFLQFLSDNATLGEAALPPGEVATTEWLMSAAQVQFPGQPVGPVISYWLGRGDTGNESALFPAVGGLSPSQVLGAGVDNFWSRIDLAQSPLVIACEAR
jgi:hypothetical protein